MKASRIEKIIEISALNVRNELMHCLQIIIPYDGIYFSFTESYFGLYDEHHSIILFMKTVSWKDRWRTVLLKSGEISGSDSIESLSLKSDKIILRTVCESKER